MAKFQLSSSGADLVVRPVSPTSSLFSTTTSTRSNFTKEFDENADEELMDFNEIKIEPEDDENSTDHLYCMSSSSNNCSGSSSRNNNCSTGLMELPFTFSFGTKHKLNPLLTRCTLCPTPIQFDSTDELTEHLSCHLKVPAGSGRRSKRCPRTICTVCHRTLKTSASSVLLIHLQRHLLNHQFVPPDRDETTIKKQNPPSNPDLVKYQEVDESNKILHVCPICTKKFKLGGLYFRSHMEACEFKRAQKLAEEKAAEERAKMAQMPDTSDDDEDEGQQQQQKIPICSLCESSFDTPAELTVHLEMEHTKTVGGMSYICPICKWSFKTVKNSYRSHLRIHSGEAQYMCPVCKDTFVRLPDLQAHLHKHKPNRKYRCVYCPRFFPMKIQVEIHSQETHDKKLHPCLLEDCEKSMETAEDLTTHMTAVHPKQRFCSECDARFQDKRNLRTHELIHVGKRPQFKCGRCHISYLRHSTFAAHSKLPHEFKCFECPVSVVGKLQLFRHYSTCHVTRSDRTMACYKCPFCKEPFSCMTPFVEHSVQCPSRNE